MNAYRQLLMAEALARSPSLSLSLVCSGHVTHLHLHLSERLQFRSDVPIFSTPPPVFLTDDFTELSLEKLTSAHWRETF